MEKFVNKIYNDLKRYEPFLQYIDKKDVKQEIRFAIITAKKDFIYKVAHKLIYNLMCDFGYSKKKGKNNFQPFYNQPEFTEDEQKILNKIELYYQIEDNTGKKTAQKFGFEYNNKTAKILAACYPKNKSNRLKSKNK